MFRTVPCKDHRAAGIVLPLDTVLDRELVPALDMESVPELERMVNNTHIPTDDRMNNHNVDLDPFHTDILQMFARILHAKTNTTDRATDILLPLAPELEIQKDFQLDFQLAIQLEIQKATELAAVSATALAIRAHNKCNSIPARIHTQDSNRFRADSRQQYVHTFRWPIDTTRAVPDTVLALAPEKVTVLVQELEMSKVTASVLHLATATALSLESEKAPASAPRSVPLARNKHNPYVHRNRT